MNSEVYSLDYIKNLLKEEFGDNKNYLLALRHDGFKRGLSKIVSANIFINREKSDLYLLYFDKKGIYKKNLTNSTEDDFKLIYWNKIDYVNLIEKAKLSILEVSNMGQIIGFEIPYDKDFYKENEENIKKLKEINWNNNESFEELI